MTQFRLRSLHLLILICGLLIVVFAQGRKIARLQAELGANQASLFGGKSPFDLDSPSTALTTPSPGVAIAGREAGTAPPPPSEKSPTNSPSPDTATREPANAILDPKNHPTLPPPSRVLPSASTPLLVPIRDRILALDLQIEKLSAEKARLLHETAIQENGTPLFESTLPPPILSSP